MLTLPRLSVASLSLLLAVVAPGRSAAQNATVIGTVVDTLRRPLDLVQVLVLPDTIVRVLTDSSGRFVLRDIQPGAYQVGFRRLGFHAAQFTVQVVPGEQRIQVELWPLSQVLDTVTVAGTPEPVRSLALERVGFYERQRDARDGAGRGFFLGPEEIEARRAVFTTQLLGAVQGLNLRPDGPRDTGRIMVPWGRSGCVMAIFMDGVETQGIYTIMRGVLPDGSPPRNATEARNNAYNVVVSGPGLDQTIRPSMIKAIEVYNSGAITPHRFISRFDNRCGSIVIWTRID